MKVVSPGCSHVEKHGFISYVQGITNQERDSCMHTYQIFMCYCYNLCRDILQDYVIVFILRISVYTHVLWQTPWQIMQLLGQRLFYFNTGYCDTLYVKYHSTSSNQICVWNGIPGNVARFLAWAMTMQELQMKFFHSSLTRAIPSNCTSAKPTGISHMHDSMPCVRYGYFPMQDGYYVVVVISCIHTVI